MDRYSKQELLHYFQELKTAGRDLHRIHSKLAYYGSRLRLTDSWGELGFEDEEAAREAAEFPSSTWHKYIRIGCCLQHLDLTELDAIRPRNLELLTYVSGDLWAEHNWVSEARELSAHELSDLITRRNLANGSAKEPMAVYRESMPFSASEMIRGAVRTFQQDHEIASPGRALELLVADTVGRVSYVGSLVKIRRILSDLKVTLQAKGILDMEIHDLVDLARAECGEKVQEALQNARQTTRGPDQRSGQRGPAAESSGTVGVKETEMGGMEDADGTLLSVQ